jgi:formate/nitrite transporter FocA (FNT family)
MPSAREGPPSFFAATAYGWEAFISFFKIAQAQRVCHVPTHAHQHYLERIVQPPQHFGYRRTQRFHCRSYHSVRSRRIPTSVIATEPGFVIVILGQQQLFTESTLSAVLSVLTRRDATTVAKTGRLWGLVLFGNIAGTLIFAAMLQIPGIFTDDVVKALGVLANQPFSSTFMVTVVRAVFAGWLIALMVWLLPSARSARLVTILLITYVVGISKLSHVIAGSVEASYGVMVGAASVQDYVRGFFAPTLLGNMIGGTSLVAIINHGSIAAEITDSDEQG